jgi:TonB family protein
MPATIVLLLTAAMASDEIPDRTLEIALTAKVPALGAKQLAAAAADALPDRPLALVKVVKPIYPEAGRVEGLSGTVQLEVSVDEEGEVDTVKTLNGHPVLADAATSAVRRWKYQAAVVGGKAVRSTTTVKLNFKAPE